MKPEKNFPNFSERMREEGRRLIFPQRRGIEGKSDWSENACDEEERAAMKKREYVNRKNINNYVNVAMQGSA